MNVYIRNPWPDNPNLQEDEFLEVKEVIREIEIEAGKGCGLHYEALVKYVINYLQHFVQVLSVEDEAKLMKAAQMRGYYLDAYSVKKTEKNFNDLKSRLDEENI